MQAGHSHPGTAMQHHLAEIIKAQPLAGFRSGDQQLSIGNGEPGVWGKHVNREARLIYGGQIPCVSGEGAGADCAKNIKVSLADPNVAVGVDVSARRPVEARLPLAAEV
jgi:hypothetical protein